MLACSSLQLTHIFDKTSWQIIEQLINTFCLAEKPQIEPGPLDHHHPEFDTIEAMPLVPPQILMPNLGT